MLHFSFYDYSIIVNNLILYVIDTYVALDRPDLFSFLSIWGELHVIGYFIQRENKYDDGYFSMNKFPDSMYVSSLFAKSDSNSISFKRLNLMHLSSIVEFLSEYINVGILKGIDIYVVDGCLLKENNPAYALYYDGDEDNFSFGVIDNKQHKINTRIFNKPTILLSSEIISDTVLFETTLIHELSHYLDGMSSGEGIAQSLEYVYLCEMHGFSEDSAYNYLQKKYYQ